MNLPKEYTEKMRRLFGEKEYQQYLDAFAEKKQAGLRINTLKWSKKQLLQSHIFDTEDVHGVSKEFIFHKRYVRQSTLIILQGYIIYKSQVLWHLLACCQSARGIVCWIFVQPPEEKVHSWGQNYSIQVY